MRTETPIGGTPVPRRAPERRNDDNGWFVLVLAAALAALTLVMAGLAHAQVNPQDYQALEASSAKTATSAGNAVTYYVPQGNGQVTLMLDVTAAATEAGDTLDVFVQTTLDGTNWVDVCHFTQVVGNGGAKRHYAKINATEPQAMFDNSTALAAGQVRNLVGTRWRCRWSVTDATTIGNVSFTFSVRAGGLRTGVAP